MNESHQIVREFFTRDRIQRFGFKDSGDSEDSKDWIHGFNGFKDSEDS